MENRLKLPFIIALIMNIGCAVCIGAPIIWNKSSDLIYFQKLSEKHPEYTIFAAYLKSSGLNAEPFRRLIEPLVTGSSECILIQRIGPESPFKGYLLYRPANSEKWQITGASDSKHSIEINSDFNRPIEGLISDAEQLNDGVDFYGHRTLDAPASFLTVIANNRIVRFAVYPAKENAGYFDSSTLKLIARAFTIVNNITGN